MYFSSNFPIKSVVRTNGGFTELLVSDLVGYVCSHKDSHCDAQLSFDHLRDQPQSLWALIHTLHDAITNRITSTYQINTNLIITMDLWKNTGQWLGVVDSSRTFNLMPVALESLF